MCKGPTESRGPGTPRLAGLSMDFITGGRKPSEGLSRGVMWSVLST